MTEYSAHIAARRMDLLMRRGDEIGCVAGFYRRSLNEIAIDSLLFSQIGCGYGIAGSVHRSPKLNQWF